MADKKITDLQLRSDVDDDTNFPVDDTIQTYRVTAVQIWDYIKVQVFDYVKVAIYAYVKAQIQGEYQASGSAVTVTAASRIIELDPTSSSITQTLPAVESLATGLELYIKNVATNGNIVTIDPNSSELIEFATTLVLNSGDSVRIFNNGTKWSVF